MTATPDLDDELIATLNKRDLALQSAESKRGESHPITRGQATRADGKMVDRVPRKPSLFIVAWCFQDMAFFTSVSVDACLSPTPWLLALFSAQSLYSRVGFRHCLYFATLSPVSIHTPSFALAQVCWNFLGCRCHRVAQLSLSFAKLVYDVPLPSPVRFVTLPSPFVENAWCLALSPVRLHALHCRSAFRSLQQGGPYLAVSAGALAWSGLRDDVQDHEAC